MIRARLEVEATNLSAELDAETAKKSPTPYLVGRLRGLLVKVLRQLGQSTPAAPTAKPKASVADLIAKANADPAGDEPEELRGG